MLENYTTDDNGVIVQIKKNIISYDENYVLQRYDTYGHLNLCISNLRLGNIIGSIGKIPNSILDIGYGNGSFLKSAKTIIPNCFGHDTSGYTIPEDCVFVEDIFSRHFNVVTFFDSLEHYEDIYFVNNINCDFVCISLPWCHYFSDEWFESWKHRRPNEHIWHFNEKSLIKFMDNQGYQVINITNIEDSIRKSAFDYQNILTGIFSKK